MFSIPTSTDVPTNGYWGAATALHQFCEPKYATSHYVAEFYNSVSSFIYVVAAAHMLSQREVRQDPFIAGTAVSIALIGLGSVLFHGTMRFEWELCDEVPMLVFICIAMLCKCGAHPMLLTPRRQVAFAALVVGACAATIAAYAYLAVYELFVASFTFFVLADLALACTWRSRQRVTAWAMYSSVFCIVVGKIVWEIEVRACSSDGRVWPLHVVWHGLSCASAYFGLLADLANRIDCGLSAATQDGATRVGLNWACVPFTEVRVVCANDGRVSKGR